MGLNRGRTVASARGDRKGSGDDYFGESLANKSKGHRTYHAAALRGWYNATAAVATAPVILGDKDNEVRTSKVYHG